MTYKRHINALFNATLFPLVNSKGGSNNVPENTQEASFYLGGLSVYKSEIMEEIERGYPNFQMEALRMA